MSTSTTTYLSRLEEEFAVPIRILDGANRMVVPTIQARDQMETDLGAETYVLESAYSGVDWRPDHHPDACQDFENGLSIFVRGTLGPPWAVSTIDVVGLGNLAAHTNGRNLADLWSGIQSRVYQGDRTHPAEDFDWTMDYAEQPWPDWRGADVAVPLAAAATWEGLGRVIAYGFQPNRINTGDVATGRVNRDVLWRDVIEALLGDTEEIRQRTMERARERFREFNTNRLGTRINEVRGSVTGLENALSDHEQALTSTRDSLRLEKLTLDTLLKMQEGDTPAADPDTEWEAIQNHNMVERLSIRGDRFVIDTVELTLTDPDDGRTATLGKFRISFPMRPGSGLGVQMENLTNAKDDGSGIPRHHPHIAQNRPCFGSLMNEVSRLGASGEVGGMLEVLLQYLQTYNPRDDYGRYAGLWFTGRVQERRPDTTPTQEVHE